MWVCGCVGVWECVRDILPAEKISIFVASALVAVPSSALGRVEQLKQVMPGVGVLGIIALSQDRTPNLLHARHARLASSGETVPQPRVQPGFGTRLS